MNREEIKRLADELRREVLQHIQCRQPNAVDARQYLHPRYAAEYLGYSYEEHPDLDLLLGISGSAIGFFDRNDRLIAVSDSLPLGGRRFTGLHEIGHIVLHRTMRAHRDWDQSSGERKPRIEWEADQFATEYAMPEAWIKIDVKDKFGHIPIKPDDDLHWRLDPNDPGTILAPWNGRSYVRETHS